MNRRSPRAYGARAIRRPRRTRAEMATIREAILATLASDHPQTVRGLFYQLVSQGVVPKTEAAYKSTVGRLTVELRESDDLPYDWLADNTHGWLS